MPLVNGLRLLSCSIRAPRVGNWHLDFEADVSDEESLDSLAIGENGRTKVTLEHEGVEFVGSLVRGGQKGAVYQGNTAGGTGGISKELPSRSYVSDVGVTVAQVVSDILRESGGTLSSTADASVLEKKVPRWTRTEGIASQSLVKIAAKVGATWRMLRDGTVWFGLATFPAAVLEPMTLVEDWSDGAILGAASEQGGAGPLLLEPGTAFHGQKLELVEHVLTASAFRTVAKNRTLGGALDKFLAGIRQEIDFSRFYPAKIDVMNADGTVAVTPDDAKLKGQGLDKVPIYTGSPGAVTVPAGVRCLVGFEAGDPSQPFVALWRGTPMTAPKLGGGARSAARR